MSVIMRCQCIVSLLPLYYSVGLGHFISDILLVHICIVEF